jgi:hypothetical protein
MAFSLSQQEFVDALRQTLEEAAFVFVEAVEPGGAPWGEGALVEARIEFGGPETGVISIAVSRTHAIALAANLLGVDEAAPEAERAACDAVGELANILCGVSLDRWFPDDGAYHMGTPDVRAVPAAAYEDQAARAALRQTMVTDEGNRIDASVFAGGAPADRG